MLWPVNFVTRLKEDHTNYSFPFPTWCPLSIVNHVIYQQSSLFCILVSGACATPLTRFLDVFVAQDMNVNGYTGGYGIT